MEIGSLRKFAALTVIVFVLCIGVSSADDNDFSYPWTWACEAGRCRKTEITAQTSAPLSLDVCQVVCGESGALWPRPTGHLSLGNYVLQLDPNQIEIHSSAPVAARDVGVLIKKNIDIIKSEILAQGGSRAKTGGRRLVIHFSSRLDPDDTKLTLYTDESYVLEVYELGDGRVNASIDAQTYYGARHALETLSQLVVYNDLKNEIQMVRDAYIVDAPVYPYRGMLLDTSRNFVDKETIMRTIRGMGMNKLNTFHWHITDSHSFPYQSRTYPNLTKYGAYTPDKIYSHKDVEEIVHWGLVNGVRVLPEFDAPAHVGEGWQWVGDDATICFNAVPWSQYCVEPPCGQLNPASNRVYEILEGIYRDMVADFSPDIFHMGGDEVSVACWNTSSNLKEWMTTKGWGHTEADFYKVWDHFQRTALDKFTLANGGREIPIILWTSGLTSEENIRLLDPSKYIIQIWTTAEDRTIARLIENNFKVIFSNYDTWYFDCGFGAWVGEGNNWCSPYKGWQTVYDNSPLGILTAQGFSSTKKDLILGGEAALWSEQADSSAIDTRIWPRAAALAERLWAEPKSSWIHAEQRMLRHRERMVARGIGADTLQPEWCRQNQGYC